MYLLKIFMEDSGRLSYLIGCSYEGTACVVDPKRDVPDYLDTAKNAGMKITHIFDTRKPGDSYLNGNMELMLRTEAKLYYLNKEAFQVKGTYIMKGDIFRFGNAQLEIIEDPRHDLFAGTIRITDISSPAEPWVILGRYSVFVGNLVDAELSSKGISEELTCYLDAHEAYAGASSMVESV